MPHIEKSTLVIWENVSAEHITLGLDTEDEQLRFFFLFCSTSIRREPNENCNFTENVFYQKYILIKFIALESHWPNFII